MSSLRYEDVVHRKWIPEIDTVSSAKLIAVRTATVNASAWSHNLGFEARQRAMRRGTLFGNAGGTGLPVTRRGGGGRGGSGRGGSGGVRPTFITLLALLAVSLASTVFLYFWLLRDEERSATEENLLGEVDWSPSPTFCSRVTPPVVCAHGGTSDAHPNTLEAIRGVAAAGLQCVEIDVSRTADDVLVACHGRDLATLMGATAANVGDFTSDDIFALQSDRGHRVPTFQAAVQAAVDSGLRLVTVDAKPAPPRGEAAFAADVLQVLGEVNCGARCQLWAKSDALVHETNAISSGTTRTGYVVMNQTAAARAAGMDQLERIAESAVVATYYGMIDTALVARAHRARKQVHAWTVNDMAAVRQVLDAGVDALVTNYPQEIHRTIETLRRQCHRQAQLQSIEEPDP